MVISLAVAAILLVTALLFAGRSQKGISVGWCCLSAGGQCGGGYDAVLCRDSGGIAYSTAESACSMACSLSVAHAQKVR